MLFANRDIVAVIIRINALFYFILYIFFLILRYFYNNLAYYTNIVFEVIIRNYFIAISDRIFESSNKDQRKLNNN